MRFIKLPHCAFTVRLTCGLVSLSAPLLLAQTTPPNADQKPQRGFVPSGSYALSDIETINLQNGNVNFAIPLVSLPPGRGGGQEPGRRHHPAVTPGGAPAGASPVPGHGRGDSARVAA